MHPDLLNNSLFLRHYNRWLKNPDSIVFAAVAEFFIAYGMLDEAIKVCREGLGHQPRSVAGRLALAKAHLKKGDLKHADEELVRILEIVPDHTKALDLRVDLEMGERGEASAPFAAAPQELPEVESMPDEEEDGDTKLNFDGSRSTDVPGMARRSGRDSTIMSPELPAWQTVTMAKIYSSQGHAQKARRIYEAILTRDPTNEAARLGLDSLGGGN